MITIILKMAQQMLDNNSIKLTKTSRNENSQIFSIDESKHIKLYYSTVYKQPVLAFCLSSSKNFILNKKAWEKFKSMIPFIEEYFKNNV
jgi:hypothetical protein